MCENESVSNASHAEEEGANGIQHNCELNESDALRQLAVEQKSQFNANEWIFSDEEIGKGSIN